LKSYPNLGGKTANHLEMRKDWEKINRSIGRRSGFERREEISRKLTRSRRQVAVLFALRDIFFQRAFWFFS
jgi:hypothetical protein